MWYDHVPSMHPLAHRLGRAGGPLDLLEDGHAARLLVALAVHADDAITGGLHDQNRSLVGGAKPCCSVFPIARRSILQEDVSFRFGGKRSQCETRQGPTWTMRGRSPCAPIQVASRAIVPVCETQQDHPL
jgi:hypothetical protein